jgi:hypothetical protein
LKIPGPIPAVVVAVAVFFIVSSLEDKVTDEMVSKTSRLAFPAGWKQLSDIVRGGQFLCMSTNPCPSIARRWQADAAITVEGLQQIAAPAGLVLSVEGACQRPANALGPTTVCIGRGAKDGYKYQLTVSSEDAQAHPEVALDVRPS